MVSRSRIAWILPIFERSAPADCTSIRYFGLSRLVGENTHSKWLEISAGGISIFAISRAHDVVFPEVSTPG